MSEMESTEDVEIVTETGATSEPEVKSIFQQVMTVWVAVGKTAGWLMVARMVGCFIALYLKKLLIAGIEAGIITNRTDDKKFNVLVGFARLPNQDFVEKVILASGAIGIILGKNEVGESHKIIAGIVAQKNLNQYKLNPMILTDKIVEEAEAVGPLKKDALINLSLSDEQVLALAEKKRKKPAAGTGKGKAAEISAEGQEVLATVLGALASSGKVALMFVILLPYYLTLCLFL